MVLLDNNTERYVSLADVAEKCSSLAEKWDILAKKQTSLENRLIKLALQGKLNLYCFKLIQTKSEKRWFLIRGPELEKVLYEYTTTIHCMPILNNPRNGNSANIVWNAQLGLDVEVKKNDLYFNLNELGKFEKDDPELSGVKVKTESHTSEPEESGIARSPDTSKGQLDQTVIGRRTTTIQRRSKT